MRKPEPKITLTIEGRKVTLTMEGGVPPTIAQAIPDFVASALKQSNILQSKPDKPEAALLEADSFLWHSLTRSGPSQGIFYVPYAANHHCDEQAY